MAGRDALIVFVRAPRLGEVKTRLAAEIGEEAALAVYRGLAEHTVAVARELDGVAIRVWYTPGDAREEVREWLGDGLEYSAQAPGELGERMSDAFAAAFSEGFERVVIVGSDLPALSTEIVRRALSLLRHEEAVIGPASDGGYYLLGLTRPFPRLFRDIPWGTDRVLARTLEVLGTEDIRPPALELLGDVDTAADLAAFEGRISEPAGADPHSESPTDRSRLEP